MPGENPSSLQKDEDAAVEQVVSGVAEDTPPQSPSASADPPTRSPPRENQNNDTAANHDDAPAPPSSESAIHTENEPQLASDHSPPEPSSSDPATHTATSPPAHPAPHTEPASPSEGVSASLADTLVDEENKPSVANSETTAVEEDSKSTDPVTATTNGAQNDDAESPRDSSSTTGKDAVVGSAHSTPAKSSSGDSTSKPSAPEQDPKVVTILEINGELIK